MSALRRGRSTVWRWPLVLALATGCTAARPALDHSAPATPPASGAGHTGPAASAAAAPQSPAGAAQPAIALTLPNEKDSLKFAVLGDFGTGDPEQYALARRMADVHERFPFELVVLVGDNIYGSDRPQDFKRKFETPYAPLLEHGVVFHASLGNHDAREQRFYKLFNMDGNLYYSFKAPQQSVRFFALESTYMEPDQVAWLKEALKASNEDWKIVFEHHPMYSSGGTHGSDMRLRATLEPILLENGVSLVLAGHDHIYERTKPQFGILHFVAGSGGKLRKGDVRPNQPFSAMVVDDTNVFLAAEISGDTLWFNAVAADGRLVDSGRFTRRTTSPRSTHDAADGGAR
jgi:hypothetical protein